MAGVKNSGKEKIHLNSFIGGMSVDYKYGIANSFYFSQALDFRTKPSQISVLPALRNISSTLPDMPLAMVQDPTGKRYMTGTLGYIYRVSTSNVVSTLGKMNSIGAAGIVYNQQSDQLYMSGQQTVSMYGQLSNGPQLRLDQFGKSASTANGTVNMFDTATNAYDIPRNNAASVAGGITSPSQVTNTLAQSTGLTGVINENVGGFCPFIPDIEPFYSIAVYLVTTGSGNITLTLHDSLNNQLAQVTINNAQLVVGWNEFVFPAPGVRAIPNAFATGTAAGYHFHLTSNGGLADGANVATVNPGDLTGANFLLFAYRLVSTNNGWHPMTTFGQYMCIGNGPYLSTYNFSNDNSPNNQQWVRHQLSLDFGYEVCGLSVNNQYLVIAAEKRSSNVNRNFQDGMLYFWDGVNVNFNFKIQIPMGAPFSIYTMNNITYFICAGSLFAWGGGQQVIKVRYISYQNTDYLGAVDSTIVNPNMMTSRYNLLMMGFPGSTTNTNAIYGVYSWGAVELSYPNSFGLSYALSNGLTNYQTTPYNNHLQIGCVANFVDAMYVSSLYFDSNGVQHNSLDVVDNLSSPASIYSWQSLIWDGGVRYKTKKALRLRVNFLPLPANTTLNIQYQFDRGGWVTADPTSGLSFSANVGDTALTIELDNSRFKEIQMGFFGTCSNATTAPTITGVTMEIDPLTDEYDIRANID